MPEPVVVVLAWPERLAREDLTIDFDRFAQHVERHDDELSRLFAASLRRWKTPAGA